MTEKISLISRSLEKLTSLVDESMRSIGGQKLLLPCLTPKEPWNKTNRWQQIGDEMFKIKDRHGQDLALGPTHEETITTLISGLALSHRNLPFRLYQIQTKFRDESNPRYGILRSREFIMKDLYTFDKSIEDAKETYEQVNEAYDKLFERLAVPFVKVTGDPGSIGGSVSHEYHFPAKIGEDVLLQCQKCKKGTNVEMGKNGNNIQCSICHGEEKFKKVKGIEVGHTFLLGDKYSKVLSGIFNSPEDRNEVLQMGCYGIGISRILGASVEVLSTHKSLRWPMEIVPFKTIILAPQKGWVEYAANDDAERLYEVLNSEVFLDDVVIDDREHISVGKKLREAKKTGYPFIILFGKDSIDPDQPKVEVYDVYNGDKMEKMSIENAISFLRSQKVK